MGLILDSSILISAKREKFDLVGLPGALSTGKFFLAAITASELVPGLVLEDIQFYRI